MAFLFSLNLQKAYKLKNPKSNAVSYSPNFAVSFGQDDLTVTFHDTYGLARTDSDGFYQVSADYQTSEMSGGYPMSNLIDFELWTLNTS